MSKKLKPVLSRNQIRKPARIQKPVMIKTLKKVGNSLALIIDRPVLELLGIDGNTQLRVTTDGRGLHVRPVAEDHRARVLASAERMADIHAESFEKLAK